MNEMLTTLGLLLKDDKILLAKKKRGFGAGKFNGVGGKLEKNETFDEAILRETYEEINVKLTDFEKVGILTFDEYFKGKKEHVIFHLYLAHDWIGDIKESDEVEPHWFKLTEIPYDNMFPDDYYWLPLILDGKKIKAYFDFDENYNIISKNIEIVENLNE